MTKNQLSKTCINCGLQKPLTAYLQIAGAEGSTYGNICSTCRGSGLGKKVTLPVMEDTSSSSSSTGLKIDAKSKIHADLEKKAVIEKRQEEDKKEREKLDLKNTILEERKNLKQEMEDKHRKEFLAPSKTKSFLDYQSKKPEDKRIGMEKRALDEVMQHETEAKEEKKNRDFDDLTVSRIDPTQATAKTASAVWKQFRTLLGGSAAFNVVEQQLENAENKKDALLEPHAQDVTRPNDARPLKKDAISGPATPTIPAEPKAQSNKDGFLKSPANNKRDSLLGYVQTNFEDDKPAPTSPGTRRR
jgi:hypothetical protein